MGAFVVAVAIAVAVPLLLLLLVCSPVSSSPSSSSTSSVLRSKTFPQCRSLCSNRSAPSAAARAPVT